MTHPTPPLSGENLLLDDEDIILLTDEIPRAEHLDNIEICQLADRSETPEVPKISEIAKEKPAFVDLNDVIELTDFKTEPPPDFSVSEADIFNFDLQDPHAPDAFDLEQPTTAAIAPHEVEFQADDLQRLINEVVHDSQVPPQEISGMPPETTGSTDSSIMKDDLTCLPRGHVDAALERVIRNLFAERIESILNEVITTTVNREVENIKSILVDYLTSGKTVHNIKS